MVTPWEQRSREVGRNIFSFLLYILRQNRLSLQNICGAADEVVAGLLDQLQATVRDNTEWLFMDRFSGSLRTD